MTDSDLGEIELQTGTLVVLDFGCLAMFGDTPEAIRASLDGARAEQPAGASQAQLGALAFVVVDGLPVGRHRVRADLIADGDYAGMRRSVTVELGPGEVAETVTLGTVLVDTARLGLFDRVSLPAWNEHEPRDGLADVAVWGRDQDQVAAEFGLARTEAGDYGVVDRPFAEALELARAIHAVREAGELRFAFDFRPHTDPYYLLGQIRASASESGTLELGGCRACGFMTGCGDGWFPVELDRDAGGAPLRVRILLFDDRDEDEDGDEDGDADADAGAGA